MQIARERREAATCLEAKIRSVEPNTPHSDRAADLRVRAATVRRGGRS
jgi:hypothetical protein